MLFISPLTTAIDIDEGRLYASVVLMKRDLIARCAPGIDVHLKGIREKGLTESVRGLGIVCDFVV